MAWWKMTRCGRGGARRGRRCRARYARGVARCWKGAAEDGGMSVMTSSAPACYPTDPD